MHFSQTTLLLLLTPVLASPGSKNPGLTLNTAQTPLAATDALTAYFSFLSSKSESYASLSSPPECVLSKTELPSSTLPTPSTNLTLLHIAIGRGTQNYTCTTGTTTPKASGATASLFNATCPISIYPTLSTLLPSLYIHFPLSSYSTLPHSAVSPAQLDSSGIHYFQWLNETASGPYFDLDFIGLGAGKAAVNISVVAPSDAEKGLEGEKAVPWLKLLIKDNQTALFKEVYRVNTVGGSAPETCTSNGTLTREYAAEYWFYG